VQAGIVCDIYQAKRGANRSRALSVRLHKRATSPVQHLALPISGVALVLLLGCCVRPKQQRNYPASTIHG
jgi:hypothetical protein